MLFWGNNPLFIPSHQTRRVFQMSALASERLPSPLKWCLV
jgi:hypothetical protein